MTLGELFSVARDLRGMTQRELEAKCGVSNSLISQIETGYVRDPGFFTVMRIAGALGLSLERVASVAIPQREGDRPASPNDEEAA